MSMNSVITRGYDHYDRIITRGYGTGWLGKLKAEILRFVSTVARAITAQTFRTKEVEFESVKTEDIVKDSKISQTLKYKSSHIKMTEKE